MTVGNCLAMLIAVVYCHIMSILQFKTLQKVSEKLSVRKYFIFLDIFHTLISQIERSEIHEKKY